MRRLACLAAVLLLTGLAGCQQETHPPVPPLRAETMGKPPVTVTPLIWRPGHWDWTSGGYEWIPGTFVPREGHGDMWMPGFWARTGQGWQWQAAHWVP